MKTYKTQTSQYWLNRTITLFSQYYKHKKDTQFIQEIISSITNWRLNEANIDNVEIIFSRGIGSLGAAYNNTIYINEELLLNADKLNKFTSLIDTLLHELYHIEYKTAVPNETIFSFDIVFNSLMSMCKYDMDDAMSLSLGMYFTNKGEINTIHHAVKHLEELNNASIKVFKKNRLITRMLHYQSKNINNSKKINKDCIKMYIANKKRLIEELTIVRENTKLEKEKQTADEIIELMSNYSLE